MLCDEQGRNGLFVLTGSQNLLLAQDLSQSLAGRNALLELHPPSLGELRRFPHCPKELLDVLVAGAYPRIHDQGIEPSVWLGDYVQTYVERDVRQLLNVGNLTTFRVFVALCAGRTGQVTNYQALADDCGVTHKTAKAWLAVLEASHLIFLVPALHRNIRKRLTKTPKLYFMDTGLVCHLLGIKTAEQLRTHPLRGAIFETWVMSEIIKGLRNRGSRTAPLYFRDRDRHEVDIIIESGEHLHAIEIKSGATLSGDYFKSLTMFRELMVAAGDSPAVLRSALVYAGSETRTVHGIQVVPWDQLATLHFE